jgi:signal transduction histidine kinase
MIMPLRPRDLPLRLKLPLLMAGQLAVVLVFSLLLTDRILTRAAETAARSRLERAVREIAHTAEEARAWSRAREVDAAYHPAVLAALGEGQRPRDASTTAAVTEVLAGLAPAPFAAAELWTADARRVAFAGPPSTGATRPPLPQSPLAQPLHGPLFQLDDHVVAWSIVPVASRGRVLGYLATLFRVGGPPDAVRTLSELTGEQVTLHLRNAADDFWAVQPGAGVPPPQRHAGPELGYQRAGVGRTIAAEAAIAGTPWLVVLETPARLVQARARAATWYLAAGSVLLLALALLASLWLAYRITRPLAAVSRTAAAIARGDYDRRVGQHGGDEVGRLAASFDQMAAEVEASRAALVARIEETQRLYADAERMRLDAEHARVEAERANRAKSDFLAVMSHELRTPLNAIAGYTDLLAMEVPGPLSDGQRDALERIVRNEKHLLQLIDDLLSYAKLEAAEVRYVLRDVPVAAALEELESATAPQVAAAGVRLALESCPRGLTARADPDKLRQIMLNLLSNAIKFTPRDGTITVWCGTAGERVLLHVRDTGVGIPADRLEAIFDPFYQVGRALDRPAVGVGLGLTISRDLAVGMGGDLYVASEPGAGSTFTLSLPLGRAAMQPA